MPDLTAAQAQRLAAIEAADDAPESLRFRVAKALHNAEPRGWLHLADVAIAVITEDARS